MKAIELICWAMRLTDEGVRRLVDDMRDAPLTQPTSRGGNHPLWVMGHLACIEGGIGSVLFGEPNPVEHRATLFAPGTTPLANAGAYPPFDEVMETYRGLRERNLTLLDEVGEAGLDRVPKAVPPGFDDAMKSFGHSFLRSRCTRRSTTARSPTRGGWPGVRRCCECPPTKREKRHASRGGTGGSGRRGRAGLSVRGGLLSI